MHIHRYPISTYTPTYPPTHLHKHTFLLSMVNAPSANRSRTNLSSTRIAEPGKVTRRDGGQTPLQPRSNGTKRAIRDSALSRHPASPALGIAARRLRILAPWRGSQPVGRSIPCGAEAAVPKRCCWSFRTGGDRMSNPKISSESHLSNQRQLPKTAPTCVQSWKSPAGFTQLKLFNPYAGHRPTWGNALHVPDLLLPPYRTTPHLI